MQLEVNVGIQNENNYAPRWKALSIGLLLEKPDPERDARWGFPGPGQEGYVEERSFSGFLDEVVCLQWR